MFRCMFITRLGCFVRPLHMANEFGFAFQQTKWKVRQLKGKFEFCFDRKRNSRRSSIAIAEIVATDKKNEREELKEFNFMKISRRAQQLRLNCSSARPKLCNERYNLFPFISFWSRDDPLKPQLVIRAQYMCGLPFNEASHQIIQ